MASPVSIRWTIILIFTLIPYVTSFPDQGIWTVKIANVSSSSYFPFHKTLYRESTIEVQVYCDTSSTKEDNNLFVGLTLLKADCFNLEIDPQLLPSLYGKHREESSDVRVVNVTETNFRCLKSAPIKIGPLQADGIYVLIMNVARANDTLSSTISAHIDVSMKGSYGFLSAADWPFLPFYGTMCAVYVLYAVGWMLVSAFQWRDLLRIQFWISGLIFLGMLEKAVFYAEYQSINSTGRSVQGAVLFAEVVSCLKRSLARLLVIIVSLGFGIVKPRLGPMLHRVVLVGALYFILAAIEGCIRTLNARNSSSNVPLMLSVALALLDSGICWWIFSSLIQTTRTLRLRRNVIKLSLYRHFTNTLIFAVLASVVFMIWVAFNHKFVPCITDWKEVWFDEAYWQLLFSIILVVIMILWRPTNNNQRYAFTPLLDAADDEEDEEQQLPNEAFGGAKMRGVKNSNSISPNEKERKNSTVTYKDDDLKWVEENIPSSLGETALPSLLDSDEEIMTVRFERNKME